MPTKAESIASGKARKQTPKGKTPKEKKQHPFGPPEERAKGYNFPSPNPTLSVHAGKSTAHLPQNLQGVFAAVEKNKDGIALKDLKVAGLGKKTLYWLVRQLSKHEFLRVKAEEKPEPKKAAKAAAKEEKSK